MERAIPNPAISQDAYYEPDFNSYSNIPSILLDKKENINQNLILSL
jgi:hypothetical protein